MAPLVSPKVNCSTKNRIPPPWLLRSAAPQCSQPCRWLQGTGQGAGPAPVSLGELGDGDLVDEGTAGVGRRVPLVDRDDLQGRIAVRVEAGGSDGALEALRLGDVGTHLVTGRHAAARVVDRLADPLNDDVRGVVGLGAVGARIRAVLLLVGRSEAAR